MDSDCDLSDQSFSVGNHLCLKEMKWCHILQMIFCLILLTFHSKMSIQKGEIWPSII